jgi:hypothetical protein
MTDAPTLTRALGGRWWHGYGTAPCPVCQPERREGQNALTLKDGRDARLLAHCKKSRCGFRDILAAAGIAHGDHPAPDPAILARREAADRADREKRARQAAKLWNEAQPIAGTSAENYLRKVRSITCDLPDTLRFHRNCWHGPTAQRYPAMVALVEGGDVFAVHRTYLLPDGSGKERIEPNKMMLGAVAGGAVRLSEEGGPLVVAEGIETALSLACGLLRAPGTIWAALSTSGMQALRLPTWPERLTIAPDGDPAGKAAAHSLAERATALDWQVSLLPAPDGRDWNEILAMKGEAA